MWSSLRSDLTEFVSTVREDTSAALTIMDAGMELREQQTPEEREAYRRMKLPETFTAPLLESAESSFVENEQDEEEEEALEGEERQGGEQEKEQPPDVQDFLESFSIATKTDEIAQLLQDNPDTLKARFEELVPTVVTYEEFWQRYFFRCDPDRIAREWQDNDDKQENSPNNPMNSLGSLLGGAVKAVAAKLTDEKGAGSMGAMTASGMFQSGGARPPFVLNTAVDEDDDEEEEEELGWDDEEEEEEEEAEESQEQIEFKDEATERLEERLKQTLEERDQLHATVEMQAKKIAALSTVEGDLNESDFKKELIQLKTQLFEKESELAVVKAKMLESSASAAEKSNALDTKVADLVEKLDSRDSALSKMEATLCTDSKKMAELEGFVSKMTKEAEMMASDLKLSKEMIDHVNSEKAELSARLADTQKQLVAAEERAASNESELKTAKSDRQTAEASAVAELTAAKEQILAAEKRASTAETELAAAKQQLAAAGNQATDAALEAKTDRQSPDTASTGVKIEAPTVQKLSSEAEEDWGDDWGDDGDL